MSISDAAWQASRWRALPSARISALVCRSVVLPLRSCSDEPDAAHSSFLAVSMPVVGINARLFANGGRGKPVCR